MSLFSSLSYLLKRAASSINQTKSEEPSLLNVKRLKDRKSSNKLSLITASANSSIISNTYNEYLHFLRNSETNSSLGPLIKTKWSDFNNLTTFLAKDSLETNSTFISEGNVQLSNETYHNADFLLESWWNIFDERYMRHGWGWTISLIAAYMLILVIGVIGNVMVILVILLRPQMRYVTNMFIMNLAVADLLVVVFCVPSTLLANIIARKSFTSLAIRFIYRMIINQAQGQEDFFKAIVLFPFVAWILGTFMCKAVAYVQGVSVCASAYSLAAISLDRCQAIYRNCERPRGFSQTTCIKTVFMIWTSALSLTIPWAVVFEVKVSEYDGLRYCVETWRVEKLGDIYFLVVNLLGFYAIPLLLIFVSNWIIYWHVTNRAVPQNSASSATVRKMHQQTKHVVLRMLGVVTLIFLFSWLPIYILVIIIKFSKSISEPEYNVLGVVVPIAQWLANWNSSINPLLYAFLNKKFRRMFKSILPSCIPLKTSGQYVGAIRPPNFTTSGNTGRNFVRSRTMNDLNQNGPRNSHHQSNLRNNSLFCKHKETVVTTGAKSITTVLLSKSLENIFYTAIAEKMSKDIVADL